MRTYLVESGYPQAADMPGDVTGGQLRYLWKQTSGANPSAAPTTLQYDDSGAPIRPNILRIRDAATRTSLVRQYLIASGHPEAADMAGDASRGALHNLWRRTSAARQSRLRHRDEGRQRSAVRREQDRDRPSGYLKARNSTARPVREGETPVPAAGAKAMLRYDPKAHEAAAYVDLGSLTPDDPADWRVCTYCKALLWPDEALRVPPAKDEGGTGWRSTLCCGKGAVRLDPVQRSAALDELWKDDRNAKDLCHHARMCAAPFPLPPPTPTAAVSRNEETCLNRQPAPPGPSVRVLSTKRPGLPLKTSSRQTVTSSLRSRDCDMRGPIGVHMRAQAEQRARARLSEGSDARQSAGPVGLYAVCCDPGQALPQDWAARA